MHMVEYSRLHGGQRSTEKVKNGMVLKVSNVLGLEENFKDIRYIVL